MGKVIRYFSEFSPPTLYWTRKWNLGFCILNLSSEMPLKKATASKLCDKNN